MVVKSRRNADLERGTSVKGWFRCGKTACKGRRMFIISFSNFSQSEKRKREREGGREKRRAHTHTYYTQSVVVRLSTSHAQSLFVLFANWTRVYLGRYVESTADTSFSLYLSGTLFREQLPLRVEAFSLSSFLARRSSSPNAKLHAL